MRTLLLLILVFPSITLFSQGNSNRITVNDISLDSLDVEYVEIVGTNMGFIEKKIQISIDFGQKIAFTFSGKSIVLKDNLGKSITFNSMIDALNFMNSHGYEFVTAYIVTIGTGNMTQNVYHYLLKRK
jgi:hypothetical protein